MERLGYAAVHTMTKSRLSNHILFWKFRYPDVPVLQIYEANHSVLLNG